MISFRQLPSKMKWSLESILTFKRDIPLQFPLSFQPSQPRRVIFELFDCRVLFEIILCLLEAKKLL